MRTNLAGLAAVLALCALQAPRIADACGVPLSPKAPARAVVRSSNPSPVLLVGSSAPNLERNLRLAGHKVDRSADPASAKRGTSYAIVIVDSDTQVQAVRERFAEATVIVRSGNLRADMSSVEARVTKRPVAFAAARPPVGSKTNGPGPVAFGPERKPQEFLTGRPRETPAQPTPAPPTPAPERVTAAPSSRDEVKPKAEAKIVVAAQLHHEVFFGRGSATVSNAQALSSAVSWLSANTSASVMLEGHADPSGAAAANMALSRTRAEAVRDFLIGKGIDASRIEVKPLGNTQLKYGETDRRNRRVAIDATP